MGAIVASKKGRKAVKKVAKNLPSAQIMKNLPSAKIAEKVVDGREKAVKSIVKEKPNVFAKAAEKAGMTKKKTLGGS